MRRIFVCLSCLTITAFAVAQEAAEKPTLVLDAGGHTAKVKQVVFSPDGKELITVSYDKSIRFWDVATGEPLRTLHTPAESGPLGMLYALAISPDGKSLAVGGYGLSGGRFWVYLISLPGGEVRRVLMGHSDSICALAFSPNGRRLASASADKTARVWDVESGACELTLKGHTDALRGVAWSPDGKSLATASYDKTGRIWSATTGNEEAALRGHEKELDCVDWSRDGKTIATGGGDKAVRLWGADGKPGKTIDKLGVEVTSVRFSPDSGHLLYTGYGQANHRAVVLALRGGGDPVTFGRHTDTVASGAFSPDGALIATVDLDGKVYLWKSADGAVVHRLAGRGHAVWASAWGEGKDGQTLLWGGANKANSLKATNPLDHSFNLPELRVDKADGQPVRRASLSAGSSSVEVAAGALSLTIKRGDDKVAEWKTPEAREFINCYTLLPNDRIAVGTNFRLYLLDAKTGKWLRTFIGHTGPVWAVAPSPDGRFLLSASADETLRVWALDEVVQTGFVGVGIQTRIIDGAPTIVAIIPGGPAAVDGTLQVKDRIVGVEDADGKFVDVSAIKDVKELNSLLRGQTGTVARLKVIPADKKEPVLHKITRGQVTNSYARTAPLLSLFFAGDDWIAWTPEGYYAASPSGERLMGWQVENGPEKMASYYPASQFRKTLYRPDVMKRLLAVGSVDKAIAAADAETGKSRGHTDVAEILPPKVSITAPKVSALRLDKGKLNVDALAIGSVGNPVASLRLMLDGRPYGGEEGLKKFSDAKVGDVRASWYVDVPPGVHRLAVQATGTASVGLSNEVEVTFAPAGQNPDKAAAATNNLYVLAVGINDYPGRLKLQCAAPDAQLISQTFKDEAKGLFRKVDVKLLTDKEATRSGILQGLRWLKDNAKPGDVAVAFYAGHGDCKIAGRFFLIPVDADLKNLPGTGVSGDELKGALGDLPCSTVLLLDACYSGSIDAKRKKRALPGAADGLVRDFTYDAGLVVLCGAAKEQEAAEEGAHGFFTKALAEGLKGKAGKDRQGMVTLLKLQDYVHDRVQELSDGEQEPTISIPSTVRSFPLAKP